ncbi:centlein-like [Pomacea canaliculata]|uniref:centlein-like n=1 Tax=Pomacea canaliculata TaxID=400727 RepID=UPI000D732818|nr:centlein-like [Pomacea canaliculata]
MMKMMSVGIDSSSNKDLDYSQLLAQNKVLQSELIQCQADKDFVWSLWKRLQVSNPDVTDAISQVLQREKEKAEAKDHRVLEILQVKDDRIEELQNIVAKQAQEISELLSRKVDLQEKCAQYQTEVERLQDAVTPLEMKLKGFETKERSMDEAYRRTVEDSQREKHELQRRLTALTTELEVVREEKSSVADKRLELERTVRHLERDVSEKISKFDGLIKELEDTRLRAERAERRIQQFTQEVDFKNRELETVRKELKELWNNHNQLTEHSAQQAELIRQLQSLQHDTQIMIKNQEDAFSMEANSLQQMYADITSRYEKAKQNEADLRQQILELKKDLMDRDDAISKLEGQAKIWKEQLNNMNHGGSFLDVDLAAADRSTLEARRDLAALRQLERTLGKLDQSREQEGEDTLEFDVSYTQQTGRHSTPSRTIDRKLADTQQLLELKCRELDAIKKAHSRRLERLRAVQHSEKLLQEQLKPQEKKVQRSDPKLLQREDSDAVWNELAYFKSQNRSLEVERRNLQEEVDELRVQASTDAATQHELRVQLQAQQEEFEYQLKKWEAAGDVNNKTESELVMLKSRLQNRDMHIGKLEKDLQELASNRDTLLEEKKFFKNQANELQQELSQCRIQLADLRQTVQRQQRALEESSLARTVNTGEQREAMGTREAVDPAPEIAAPVSKRQTRHRATHKVRKPRRPASSVKEYQRVLNRSIEKMRNLFSSFHDDGWEEVSESGATEDWELEEEWEGDDDTEVTGESLGVAIVRHAHNAFSGDLIDFTEISPATEYAREPSRQAKVGVKSKLHQGPVKANFIKTTSKDAPTRSRSPPSRTHDHNPEVRAKSPVSRSRRQDHSPPVRDRVILRETATSPIPWGSIASTAPQTGNKQESKNNGRLLGVLRKRVAHLQQQLSVFKESRAGALKILKDLKESNLQLSSDLAQANQRLRIAKQNCQRLSGDLERVQKEKQSTEQQLKEELADVPDKQQDCDKRLLEAKLKMANSEVARQAATIRSLKTEVDSLQDQIRA